jgi:hypothetical protein
MNMINADDPGTRALRQLGKSCASAKRMHGAPNGFLDAAVDDPRRCGGTAEQLVEALTFGRNPSTSTATRAAGP